MTLFCPECRAEYREGFDTCSDCGVSLVAELPPVRAKEHPQQTLELVTVLETADPGLVSVTQSMFDAAGIEFVSVGGNPGAVFSGIPLLGRVRLQVRADRADEARTLLSELSANEAPGSTPSD